MDSQRWLLNWNILIYDAMSFHNSIIIPDELLSKSKCWICIFFSGNQYRGKDMYTTLINAHEPESSDPRITKAKKWHHDIYHYILTVFFSVPWFIHIHFLHQMDFTRAHIGEKDDNIPLLQLFVEFNNKQRPLLTFDVCPILCKSVPI